MGDRTRRKPPEELKQNCISSACPSSTIPILVLRKSRIQVLFCSRLSSKGVRLGKVTLIITVPKSAGIA